MQFEQRQLLVKALKQDAMSHQKDLTGRLKFSAVGADGCLRGVRISWH